MRPSTDSTAARSTTVISTVSSGPNTRARSNSMCGATGVTTMALWVGETIGPRADSV